MGRLMHLLLVGALLFLLPARVDATIMQEVPLERMIQEADVIIRGVVESSAVAILAEPNSSGPSIHTVTRVRVLESLKGGVGSVVEVRELGGEDPQLGGRWFAGTPRYEPGEEVVLFLRWDSMLSSFRTYGMAQGKFTIMHGVPGVPATVQRDLEGMAFANWVRGQMQVQAAEDVTMQLDVFLAFVRAELGALAGER